MGLASVGQKSVKAEAQRWSVRLADGSNKLLKKEHLEVKADASQGGVGDGSLGDHFFVQPSNKANLRTLRLWGNFQTLFWKCG